MDVKCGATQSIISRVSFVRRLSYGNKEIQLAFTNNACSRHAQHHSFDHAPQAPDCAVFAYSHCRRHEAVPPRPTPPFIGADHTSRKGCKFNFASTPPDFAYALTAHHSHTQQAENRRREALHPLQADFSAGCKQETDAHHFARTTLNWLPEVRTEGARDG